MAVAPQAGFNVITGDDQDESDPPPSYYEALLGLPTVRLGDSQYFSPLTEFDVRRFLAKAKNKRLDNIEIVNIRNFISFYVRLE